MYEAGGGAVTGSTIESESVEPDRAPPADRVTLLSPAAVAHLGCDVETGLGSLELGAQGLLVATQIGGRVESAVLALVVVVGWHYGWPATPW